MSGNLDDLGAAFRSAIEKLGEAQSSVGVSRDRHDEALRQISQVSDGSDNALVTSALENVAAADAALEEVLGMYQAAREALSTYLRAKGI